MRERIMTHQETNGFETIYDFLNEDLDELEKLAKDSGDIHIVSDIIEPNYDEMDKRELIIYCEYLKLQRYPVKWKYVDGSK